MLSKQDLQYKPLLHLVGILFPHINYDARSKSHQICLSAFQPVLKKVPVALIKQFFFAVLPETF